MLDIDTVIIPSQSTLECFESDIQLTSLRLTRCLSMVLAVSEDSFESSSSESVSKTFFFHFRHLGTLLRATQDLIDKIQSANEQKYDPSNQSEHRAFCSSYSLNKEDNPEICANKAELGKTYFDLLDAAVRAEKLLEEKLSLSGLPLPASCVGEVSFIHEGMISAFTNPKSSHHTNSYYIVNNPCKVRCSLEECPCELVSSTLDEVNSPTNGSCSKKSVQGGYTTQISKHPTVKKESSIPNASETEESSEEAVMRDIRATIKQVKNGALQVRHLMNEEAHVLSTSEALLSDGVGKSRKNLLDINRISEVKEASEGNMLRLIRRIPGGAIFWQTMIMPLWGFIRQIILFSLILSVVFMMMVLIISVGKPRVYRGVHRQPSISSYTAPKSSIKKAVNPLEKNYTKIDGMIEKLGASHDL
ncbi:unnamed protein product [Phytomonas sp. Hart1]|nr:unnamed protein product [Phytomonas sp. Hart1]|eukprot:CCW71970.1 unnamed protein product [Phytomonas sp. isolate Hart1]